MMKTMLRDIVRQIRMTYRQAQVKRSPIMFIRRQYKKLFGTEIDLENPTTFAEKIQWLKCYDRDPRIVRYADKYLVREFIRETIGEEYLVPLLFAYDRTENMRYEELPERFVLKPNNSSGRVLICKDKARLDKQEVYRTLKRWEKENLTNLTGEWVYEKIPYKLLCEEFLEDDIVDYKFYFADGEFICTQAIAGRAEKKKKFGYFDADWRLLDIKRKGVDKLEEPLEKPEKYEEMLGLATKLAQGFTFIRVDLYSVGSRIFFGELSFYPNNGFVRYETEEMDRFFATKIKLPQKETHSV